MSPRRRRAISATSSPRSAPRSWLRSVARWTTPPAADDLAILCPQCVPRHRNQPCSAVIAGQAERLNYLHTRPFLDLACHGLSTLFLLDKAEVTGSSPVSPTPVVTGGFGYFGS